MPLAIASVAARHHALPRARSTALRALDDDTGDVPGRDETATVGDGHAEHEPAPFD